MPGEWTREQWAVQSETGLPSLHNNNNRYYKSNLFKLMIRHGLIIPSTAAGPVIRIHNAMVPCFALVGHAGPG